jgi:hypothetical protein
MARPPGALCEGRHNTGSRGKAQASPPLGPGSRPTARLTFRLVKKIRNTEGGSRIEMCWQGRRRSRLRDLTNDVFKSVPKRARAVRPCARAGPTLSSSARKETPLNHGLE